MTNNHQLVLNPETWKFYFKLKNDFQNYPQLSLHPYYTKKHNKARNKNFETIALLIKSKIDTYNKLWEI